MYPVKPLLMCLALALGACSHQAEQGLPAQAAAELRALAEGAGPGAKAPSLLSLLPLAPVEALVRRGLAQNPELKQQLIAVDISQLQLGISRASLLPSASAGLARQQQGADQAGAEHSYRGELKLALALDINGAKGAAVAAARAEAAAARAGLQRAEDVLAAEIMGHYLALVYQRQQVRINSEQLALLQRNEDSQLDQYRRGLGQLNDWHSARSSRASAAQSLAASERELERRGRALALLLGQDDLNLPGDSEFPAAALAPLQLAGQTLGRRPDLQQAYRQIVAAEAHTAAAYRALLPSFDLNLSLSQSDGRLRPALLSSPAWTLLGQLSAPLLNGGELRRRAKISELEQQRAYWQFRQRLLGAVSELENSWELEQNLARQQRHNATALAAAELGQADYRQRYRQGIATFLELLSVQQRVFALRSQRSELHYQRLANRIQLGLALGLGINRELEPVL